MPDEAEDQGPVPQEPARRSIRDSIEPRVFIPSAVVILVVSAWAAVFDDVAGEFFTSLRRQITSTFGWFFVTAVIVFLVFTLWLALGRYRHVRLGPDDSEPDYSSRSWFAMLFSAGMGIGLLYWGVAEPLSFFALDPPRAEAGTDEAARDAMRFAFHHWSFAPWAIYAVIGMGLAYFGYRHDQPLAIRSLFRPLIGDRVKGPLGDLIDVTAVVGTMFGVATSLGLGVMQVNAGLEYVFGVAMSTPTQLVLIVAITAVATVSVVTGLDRGIQRLSQANVALAGVLLLFVLAVGPTVLLLSAFVENTGAYAGDGIGLLSRLGIYDDEEWMGTWTLFYWAWWVSWSPFVGVFIARISRGRTIREFVLGVLLVPSIVSFLWFTVLGNTAIDLDRRGAGLSGLVDDDPSLALFGLLDELPLSTISMVLATVLVISFFVTSSDSGSFVIGMLTSGGDPDPHVATRMFWACSEGLVAAALLLAGGLGALQAGAISSGLLFTVVLVLATFSIARGLRQEFKPTSRSLPGQMPPAHVADATERDIRRHGRKELERRLRERQTARRQQGPTGRGRRVDIKGREGKPSDGG